MKYFVILLVLIATFMISTTSVYAMCAYDPAQPNKPCDDISGTLIMEAATPPAFGSEPASDVIPPPLKQMKMGIKLGHIICDEDKHTTWNIHFKPACVFPDSEFKLMKRGWAKLRLMLPASADPIKELELTGQNEVTYRILGNLRVGDEPPPSTLDEKKKIVWEYAQKYHPEKRFLEYSIPTSGLYKFNVGDKIQFDLLEWGNYSECWNLKLRIIDKHDQAVYEDNSVRFCLEPRTDGQPGWFASYSMGQEFEEFVCDRAGYYRIEVSNGEIFPPTILQNFACLDTELKTSVTDTQDLAKLVDANNQFATRFYSQVSQENDDNIFFSPTSIFVAFAIAYEGSNANTAKEFEDAFGFEPDDSNRREGFVSMQNRLNMQDQNNTLTLANALWLANDFEPFDEYVNTAENYYSSRVESVDFAKKESLDIINQWVSNKTNGKIETIFNELDPATELAITNAIYFKGIWEEQFEKDKTVMDAFYVGKDSTVEVPMMELKTTHLNQTQIPNARILQLPYEGNKLSMLILLPNEIDGIDSLEKSLSAEKLRQWQDEFRKVKTKAYLPKFKLETNYNLIPPLQEIGVHDAFGNADFSGISDLDLFIYKAVHKAFVEVNEEGTEAAAATGMATLSSGPVGFKADHPFLFIIQDNETGQILFMGRVMDPTK